MYIFKKDCICWTKKTNNVAVRDECCFYLILYLGGYSCFEKVKVGDDFNGEFININPIS